MLCTNCGKEIPDSSKFCPYCGQDAQIQVLETEAEESVSEETVLETEHSSVPEDSISIPLPEEIIPAKAKKKKGKNVAIIVLAVVLLLGAVFAALYFATDVFGDGKCDYCDSSICKFSDYCGSCEKNLTCTECGKFDEETVDGFCSDCRKCRHCGEKLEKGYYCIDCIDALDNNYISACIKCLTDHRKTAGTYEYSYILEHSLKPEEIFLIDKSGLFYCKDCRSNKVCEICGGFLDKKDDDNVCVSCVESEYSNEHTICYLCYAEVIDRNDEDGVCEECGEIKYCEDCGEILYKSDDDECCSYCAEYQCYECGEVMEESEISHKADDEDYYPSYFCKDCDTGKYCETCDVPVPKDDDDNVCTYCAEFTCYECNEVLTKKEISQVAYGMYEGESYRLYYCEDCNTGKFCKDCDRVLSIYDTDDQCNSCAEITCWYCSEVMKKKEISYSFEKWGRPSYICVVCDSGKYCEDCSVVLDYAEDDEVCVDCADLTCSMCYEVITKKEISYSFFNFHYNEKHVFCEYCDTGKYCDECGWMLYKDDDDSVCFHCSDYACWSCNEVLSDSESGDIAYTVVNDGEELYFCKDCDTDHYCKDCGWVLLEFDDDDVCTDCAEFTCYGCVEVLEKKEISYMAHDEYGMDYVYCKDCDSGRYCITCGKVVYEYNDWECWSCY